MLKVGELAARARMACIDRERQGADARGSFDRCAARTRAGSAVVRAVPGYKTGSGPFFSWLRLGF